MPSDIGLADLHWVFQVAMGWTNSHLHQFVSGRTLYGMQDDDLGMGLDLDVEDENEYKLSELLRKEKDSLRYEYDFGDGWDHKVVLEKILPDDGSIRLPSCVKGKRACPPEDCGGIWGYEGLLETIKDPSHPEYGETLEWLGDDFDPERFDLEEVNGILAKGLPC